MIKFIKVRDQITKEDVFCNMYQINYFMYDERMNMTEINFNGDKDCIRVFGDCTETLLRGSYQ